MLVVISVLHFSGKTTLMRLVSEHLQQQRQPGRSAYVLNLDPAVLNLGYEVNIDIRDTVNYKQVMKQYKLGPNGAIVTALNLFATRFDQVISFIEEKQEEVQYVFIDTPGWRRRAPVWLCIVYKS